MRTHLVIIPAIAHALAVLPPCAEDAAWAAPATGPAAAAEAALPVSQTSSVVHLIRSKLAEDRFRKGANAEDLAALEIYYRTRAVRPVWMTEMGFSARGQQALFEIEKADDWGLDASAFELPPAGDLPTGPDTQAGAEIKLNLAILKYARYARGGRLNPSQISAKFDQVPSVYEPMKVLTEIAASRAPEAYLQSLHPKHDQFTRLRQALLQARGKHEEGVKRSKETDISRLIINMERWRWMPEDLGRLYVWSNTPEFMLYVVKDGNTIYKDKTQVGTIDDATPVFSADMTTIVFNPEWIAPRSVLVKYLLPRLRRKNYSILKKYAFAVSYQGNPVNPAKIDWGRVNIRDYTFVQKPGPHSNLGKVKFLLPNKHGVLLHDTFPARRNVFQKNMRAIGYGCVRMEKPDRFAEVLLAEGKGWSASQIKDLWDNSVNSPVTLDNPIPVHFTYLTAVVDETGKVSTFSDLYGLDRKVASALFGNGSGVPLLAPERRPRVEEANASVSVKPTPVATGMNPIHAGEIVRATWYGNELRGNRTASGEWFNPDGMTAAHRSLPFGTCLVVGNPKTGSTTVVRVNDRGPFTRGVTLDLSAGAARAIGMHSTQNVTMKPC
jgi:murein L,D-transpeptidase YcbB/YkuD